VLGIVLRNETDAGAKCPEDFVSTGHKTDRILEILNKLVDDGESYWAYKIKKTIKGHIYSTIDDYHFKSTG